MDAAALDILREALVLALLLAAPLLLAALVVGVVTSLVQAVTQVQDQTLSFLPKTVAVVVAAVLLLGWLATRLVEFAVTAFGGAA
ncbi:MAG: flagellar biosynthetic protein FliQ [Phycisphaerales bacterium]